MYIYTYVYVFTLFVAGEDFDLLADDDTCLRSYYLVFDNYEYQFNTEMEKLGFKIENFSMVPSSSTTDLQATFTCKDITIKGISNSSSTINQSTNNQTNNTTTNTNNTTSSNSTNTANSTNNSTNTNTANNTNTTNTLR